MSRESSMPAEGGSRTMTQTGTPTPGTGNQNDQGGPSDPVVGVLKLRGDRSARRQKVVFSEGTVDNEGMGKKKSKSKPDVYDWMRSVSLTKCLQFVVSTTNREHTMNRQTNHPVTKVTVGMIITKQVHRDMLRHARWMERSSHTSRPRVRNQKEVAETVERGKRIPQAP